MTKKYINQLCFDIIGAAIKVHKHLGPGLLEQVYEKCLEYELKQLGYKVETQRKIPITYGELSIEAELRFDLLIEDWIIVELKSVDVMHPIFDAQLLSYMRLLEKPKGILINFNCKNIFKEGQKTLVNELYRSLPDY